MVEVVVKEGDLIGGCSRRCCNSPRLHCRLLSPFSNSCVLLLLLILLLLLRWCVETGHGLPPWTAAAKNFFSRPSNNNKR
jgi:hypothetical protein